MKTRQQLNATHIPIPFKYEEGTAEREYHRYVREQWQGLLDDARQALLKGELVSGGTAEYWEGKSAAAELQKLNLFSCIRDPRSNRDRRFAKLLSRELSIYRYNYSKWPGINEEFRRLKKLLRALLRKLKSFSAEISVFLLAEMMDYVALLLRKLPEQQRYYWEKSLQFTPSELSLNFFPKRGDVRAEFAPSTPGAILLEKEVSKWKLPSKNFTNRNIDTGFQVRLAALFRLFYPKLSWGCVSSLIVLVYIAGANATVDQRDELHIHPPGAKKSKHPLDAVMLEKKLKKLAPAVRRSRGRQHRAQPKVKARE